MLNGSIKDRNIHNIRKTVMNLQFNVQYDCSAKTRMHSSRMRTFCCSGRLGGGVYQGRGLPREGSVQGDVHLRPVNRITDRCKNITFPQLRLRMV